MIIDGSGLTMILCQIDGFEQREPINETEKVFFSSNKSIDKERLIKQHTDYVNVLKKYIPDCYIMSSTPNCPEQTFVRDTAFYIGNVCCISKMFHEVRKKESEKMKKCLMDVFKKDNIYQMKSNIEGGDVLVYDRVVFVGIGERTSIEAVKELEKKFNEYTIIPIYLKKGILHLDCVLGVINNIWAVVYKDGLEIDSYNTLSNYFNFIHINKKEQKNLAANFLKINNIIICDKRNSNVNRKIQKLILKQISHKYR